MPKGNRVPAVLILLCWVSIVTPASAAAPAKVSPPDVSGKVNQPDLPLAKIRKSWMSVSGKWKITSDPEHAPQPLLQQIDYSDQTALLLGRKPFTNFHFSVNLRTDTLDVQSRNWQIGIWFRHKDSEHYYKLRLTAANVALIKVVPNSAYEIPGSAGRTTTAAVKLAAGSGEQLLVFLPFNAPRDSWHTLEADCRGEMIVVKLDGRELQTLTDAGIGTGALGLFSANTRAFFANLHISVQPVPKLAGDVAVNRPVFRLDSDRDLMFYYRLNSDGPATVRVLNPSGKVFNVLAHGWHSAGLNSVLWDGQGLTGHNPEAGRYTLEVIAGGNTRRASVDVKNVFSRKEYK